MRNLTKIFGYCVLILGTISMIIPFLWMVFISFVNNNLVFSTDLVKMFNSISIKNYHTIFQEIPVYKYFLNSLFIAVVTTFFQVLISALAGYGFSRFEFKYKEALFFLVLITMIVPPQVNIIPLFFLMKELHWIDTYQALILPGIFGGFGVFLMRQWFDGFPKEIEEAAKIDGSNTYLTFFTIAMPLALPALITLAIFTFITTWNSFMWPLIVTNSDAMRTLPLGLALFKGSFRDVIQWGDVFACAVICVIPIIAVFLIGKKYFINNLLSGALKE